MSRPNHPQKSVASPAPPISNWNSADQARLAVWPMGPVEHELSSLPQRSDQWQDVQGPSRLRSACTNFQSSARAWDSTLGLLKTSALPWWWPMRNDSYCTPSSRQMFKLFTTSHFRQQLLKSQVNFSAHCTHVGRNHGYQKPGSFRVLVPNTVLALPTQAHVTAALVDLSLVSKQLNTYRFAIGMARFGNAESGIHLRIFVQYSSVALPKKRSGPCVNRQHNNVVFHISNGKINLRDGILERQVAPH